MPHRLGIHAASRYPVDPRAVFILALCVVSGLPLIILGADPATLQALLPRWGVTLWGLALVGGAVTTLVGMSLQSINGVIAEQIGSVTTGVATMVYGTAISFMGGLEAAVPAAIVFGFGLSSFWRWGQLQVWLHEQQIVVDAVRDGEVEL